MIEINHKITLQDDEVSFVFSLASGPGGQHVNRTESAVQLRFDAVHSPSLPDDVRRRLLDMVRRQVTSDGILLIEARRYRSQKRNRDDALERLVELIHRASVPPVKRYKTRPTKASVERRLVGKKQQSERKSERRPPEV